MKYKVLVTLPPFAVSNKKVIPCKYPGPPGERVTTSLYSDQFDTPEEARDYAKLLFANNVIIGYRVLYSHNEKSWLYHEYVVYSPSLSDLGVNKVI